jgi:hypothetical protein
MAPPSGTMGSEIGTQRGARGAQDLRPPEYASSSAHPRRGLIGRPRRRKPPTVNSPHARPALRGRPHAAAARVRATLLDPVHRRTAGRPARRRRRGGEARPHHGPPAGAARRAERPARAWMVRMRDGSLEPPRRTGSLEQMASLLTPLAASAGRPAGSLGAGPGRRLPSGPPPAAPAVHGVGDHGRDLFRLLAPPRGTRCAAGAGFLRSPRRGG